MLLKFNYGYKWNNNLKNILNYSHKETSDINGQVVASSTKRKMSLSILNP